MKNHTIPAGRSPVVIAVFFAVLFCGQLAGCNAQPRSGPFDVPAAVPVVMVPQTADAETLRAAEEIAAQRIYFAFDKADLSPQSMQTLTRIAALLRQHPDIRMTINGHCDKRGSVEYNYALGERRARAAYGVLTSQGVKPAQLEMYSYSKLVPASPGNTAADHARNRRDEFVVLGTGSCE